jgi:hypothetical protein
MPCGGVVNDYVPFYFSPFTAFSYTIHCGNVELRAPDGHVLGPARDEDRVFAVCRADGFADSKLRYCFSDFPLNSLAPLPTLEEDLHKLETHVHWDVFDDAPMAGSIPEIGYCGVCRYFQNRAVPVRDQNRSQKRMAEFLVRQAVPLGMIECIVAKTAATSDRLQAMMDSSAWDIPVFTKPGCYF